MHATKRDVSIVCGDCFFILTLCVSPVRFVFVFMVMIVVVVMVMVVVP